MKIDDILYFVRKKSIYGNFPLIFTLRRFFYFFDDLRLKYKFKFEMKF